MLYCIATSATLYFCWYTHSASSELRATFAHHETQEYTHIFICSFGDIIYISRIFIVGSVNLLLCVVLEIFNLLGGFLLYMHAMYL